MMRMVLGKHEEDGRGPGGLRLKKGSTVRPRRQHPSH